MLQFQQIAQPKFQLITVLIDTFLMVFVSCEYMLVSEGHTATPVEVHKSVESRHRLVAQQHRMGKGLRCNLRRGIGLQRSPRLDVPIRKKV